ncbi:MAG TPA: hypothetical protein VLJ21_02450 [Candidatus Binatia bacterium]|nr:hypothetical protein [Candidatus Binatia bacterium]
MADNPNTSDQEEYELVPYKEIQDLKEELKKLKDVPIPSSKKLQVSMDDLALKIDRMTAIFEEAGHEIKVEEGGMTFQEKMKPMMEKMNKILEQNSEIAKGIVAVADLINDLKGKLDEGFVVKKEEQSPAGDLLRPEPQFMPPPGAMTGRTAPPMGAPLPPPPKRRGGFF